jgi:putative transposase
MQLRYSYRLDPSPSQRTALVRAFGCARVVFNDGLAARRAAFEAGEPYLPDAELSKRLTELKKTPERAWLTEVSSVVLQQALADLNTAYRNFFDSVNGKRKGPRVAPPRFRSRKDSRQAVRFAANSRFKVLDNGRLRLPKTGDVKVRWSRELPSAPSSVTVIRDAAGRFFASFVIETEPEPLPETGAECGIDLGLGHFAVLDDGTKVAAPRFLRRAEKRLRKAQKALSRKEKGSKNREKARVQVARAHAKTADARRDFHHKLSTTVIRENQAVYVEDLAVKAWRGPGWRNRSTTPDGRRSRPCWSTRRSCTAATSARSAGGNRPARCAQPVARRTAPSRSMSANGHARRAAPSTTGT